VTLGICGASSSSPQTTNISKSAQQQRHRGRAAWSASFAHLLPSGNALSASTCAARLFLLCASPSTSPHGTSTKKRGASLISFAPPNAFQQRQRVLRAQHIIRNGSGACLRIGRQALNVCRRRDRWSGFSCASVNVFITSASASHLQRIFRMGSGCCCHLDISHNGCENNVKNADHGGTFSVALRQKKGGMVRLSSRRDTRGRLRRAIVNSRTML